MQTPHFAKHTEQLRDEITTFTKLFRLHFLCSLCALLPCQEFLECWMTSSQDVARCKRVGVLQDTNRHTRLSNSSIFLRERENTCAKNARLDHECCTHAHKSRHSGLCCYTRSGRQMDLRQRQSKRAKQNATNILHDPCIVDSTNSYHH